MTDMFDSNKCKVPYIIYVFDKVMLEIDDKICISKVYIILLFCFNYVCKE